jgi:hypothetical protein
MFTGCGTETTKLQALSENGRGESSCNEGHNVSVESLTVGASMNCRIRSRIPQVRHPSEMCPGKPNALNFTQGDGSL